MDPTWGVDPSVRYYDGDGQPGIINLALWLAGAFKSFACIVVGAWGFFNFD